MMHPLNATAVSDISQLALETRSSWTVAQGVAAPL
jgi:hypothetical protein